ncbi:MAG: hypothetical protein JWN43_3982 [Gammaproteobacteria bacterium]|nr:hypothetical protein [Gammaproteobacteria bacterium]
MCHAGQGPQIEFLIEVPVDVFEYTVHPRRVFSLVGFPGQSVWLRKSGKMTVLEAEKLMLPPAVCSVAYVNSNALEITIRNSRAWARY